MLVGLQQSFNALSQRCVAGASFLEHGGTLFGRQVQGALKEFIFGHETAPTWMPRPEKRENRRTSTRKNDPTDRLFAADRRLQPGAGEGPVAVGGGRGHAEHLGGLLAGKPCEITELHE